MERRYTSSAASGVELRDESSGIITGYGVIYYDGTANSEYQLWRGAVERIMPDAGLRAVIERDDARALLNHDPNELMGRVSANTLLLFNEMRGVKFDILPSDTTTYRNTKENVRLRNLQGASFGFEVLDEEWKRENGIRVREIRGFRLWDIGPVTFPAYESTTTGLRGCGGVDEARASYERWEASERRRRVAVVTGARARLIGV